MEVEGDDTMITLLTQAVEQRVWLDVCILLNDSYDDLGDEYLYSAIDETSRYADEDILIFSLMPGLPPCYRHILLTHLVERRLWVRAGELLERGVDDIGTHDWALEEASTWIRQHGDLEAVFHFLPHFSGHQVDLVLSDFPDHQVELFLQQFVAAGHWKAVGKVLRSQQDRLQISQQTWMVDQAIEHAEESDIIHEMIPNMAVSLYDYLVKVLVKKGLWGAVGQMLLLDISDAQSRWAVEMASESAAEWDFRVCIFPVCSHMRLERAFTHLVKRGMWLVVGDVLHCGLVDETSHMWALEEAGTQADELTLRNHIICVGIGSAGQLEHVLKQIVARGLWRAAHQVLQTTRFQLSETIQQWVIGEASKHAYEWELERYILPLDKGSQSLELLLQQLVKRRFWQAVGQVLQECSRDLQQKCQSAITVAMKCAEEGVLVQFILPRCSDDLLAVVLLPLVDRGLGHAVKVVLQRLSRSVEADGRHWLERTPRSQPLCKKEQLDFLLAQMVTPDFWDALTLESEENVCRPLYRMAIDELNMQPKKFTLSVNYRKHWAWDQSRTVLALLLTNGLWNVVGEVLRYRLVCVVQQEFAMVEACQLAKESDLVHVVLPHCPDARLHCVLFYLVNRRLWLAVDFVLYRCVNSRQRLWAVEQARKHVGVHDSASTVLLHCAGEQLESILEHLMVQNKWSAVHSLLRMGVSETLSRRAVREACRRAEEASLWQFYPMCHADDLVHCYFNCVKRSQRLRFGMGWDKEFAALLNTSIKRYSSFQGHFADVMAENRDVQEVDSSFRQLLEGIISFLSGHHNIIHGSKKMIPTEALKKWILESERFSITTKDRLTTLEVFITEYHKCRLGRVSDQALFRLLTIVPLFPTVQNVALNIMRHKQRWNVIRHACMSHIEERVRRDLFQAAVEKKQWRLVKQWADHTLYDDQRGWAMAEAVKRKQWDAVLQLADYGLTKDEQLRAHYQAARYGSWDTLLQVLERGTDVSELIDLLRSDVWKTPERGKTPCDQDKAEQRQRLADMILLEGAFRCYSKNFSMVLKQNWPAVLFRLFHRRKEKDKRLALEKAVDQGKWSIVTQLVRLGISGSQRDELFLQAVRQRRWGVCRTLLEGGVSVGLVQDALQEMKQNNQWILLARVMDYTDVRDDIRRDVLQYALEKKEDSLAFYVVTTLQGQLSVDEREKLFQSAFRWKLWQLIKPFVEYPDPLGVSHRDRALPRAIEHRQWDVVDRCLSKHADINITTAAGEPSMLWRARKKDWKGVEELVVRGADLSLFDAEGKSVLHRAVSAKRWKTMKLLIQFHGKLNQPDHSGETPLHVLIDQRQARLVELALFWEPDLCSGRNRRGESTLHAVCAAGWRYTMYYLIARRCDPLALTKKGESVLMYAVKEAKHTQKMVAQCISLGFSTHQPAITESWDSRRHASEYYPERVHSSPFEYALVKNWLVILHMLYESGSCSNRELFRLENSCKYASADDTEIRRYLQEVALTPRSLQSLCRLVISNCLNVRGKRHKDMPHLPLKSFARDYVMFCDLTDPDYGKNWTVCNK